MASSKYAKMDQSVPAPNTPDGLNTILVQKLVAPYQMTGLEKAGDTIRREQGVPETPKPANQVGHIQYQLLIDRRSPEERGKPFGQNTHFAVGPVVSGYDELNRGYSGNKNEQFKWPIAVVAYGDKEGAGRDYLLTSDYSWHNDGKAYEYPAQRPHTVDIGVNSEGTKMSGDFRLMRSTYFTGLKSPEEALRAAEALNRHDTIGGAVKELGGDPKELNPANIDKAFAFDGKDQGSPSSYPHPGDAPILPRPVDMRSFRARGFTPGG